MGCNGKLAGIIEWNHEENDFLEGESHGTANPNARGFWNKYFMTYQYEFVRTISR